jgi:glycosyltransferase involved in cell wall biosynthesis
MTELVIKTIHRNTKPENFRLVVVDNGSEPDVVEMLKMYHENGLIDELELLPENIGLEAARNWALHNATRSPYFICVDNDCLPPPMVLGRDVEAGELILTSDFTDWVERLMELMAKYEDMGAISCRNPVMIGTGNIFEFADEAGDDILEFPHPGGSLRIMRTDITQAIGGWDRKAPGRGSEETYICGKLRDAGFRTAFAVKIPCLHLFGTRDSGNMTDRWGYDKGMTPADSGHRDIDHPALRNGDDFEEIKLFAGKEFAQEYFYEED